MTLSGKSQHVLLKLMLCGLISLAVLPLSSAAQYSASSSHNPVILKAGVMFKAGEGKSAKALYEAALKRGGLSASDIAEANRGLAQIAEREFNYTSASRYLDAAMAAAQKVSSSNPELMASLTGDKALLYHHWSTTRFGTPANYSDKAKELINRAMSQSPDNPSVLTAMGEWSMDNGDMVTAERSFNRALDADKQFVPAFQGLTRFYIKSNDLSRAKETALHSLELDDGNSLTYFQLAQILALAEHPDKAIEYAEKSRTLDFGRMPEREEFLAKQYEKLGNRQAAMGYYEGLSQLSPNDVPTLMKLADLNMLEGNTDKATSYYRKAFTLQPSMKDNLIGLAWDAVRGQTASASLPHWRLLLQIEPGNAMAIHGIAAAHYQDYILKRTDGQALSKDIALVVAQPDSTLTPSIELERLKLAIAAERGMTAPIKQRLQQLSQNNDELVSGESLFLLGEYAKASQQLDNIRANDARDHLYIADQLMAIQSVLAAETMYQRSRDIEPLPGSLQGLKRVENIRKVAKVKIDEGNLQFDQKHYTEAIEQYRQANAIFPEWDVPWIRLGEAYEKDHQKALAYQAFHQATLITPNLMDSKGFRKRYEKLEKATSK